MWKKNEKNGKKNAHGRQRDTCQVRRATRVCVCVRRARCVLRLFYETNGKIFDATVQHSVCSVLTGEKFVPSTKYNNNNYYFIACTMHETMFV